MCGHVVRRKRKVVYKGRRSGCEKQGKAKYNPLEVGRIKDNILEQS